MQQNADQDQRTPLTQEERNQAMVCLFTDSSQITLQGFPPQQPGDTKWLFPDTTFADPRESMFSITEKFEKKRSRHTLHATVIIPLLAFLCGAGSVYAYFYVWQPIN